MTIPFRIAGRAAPAYPAGASSRAAVVLGGALAGCAALAFIILSRSAPAGNDPGENGAPDSRAVAAAGARPDPKTRSVATSPAQAPCDPSRLELSSPHGNVLAASRLILRWRTSEEGPFQVRIMDAEQQSVYDILTYGHEVRVLVTRGEGEMRGPHPGELKNGATYTWTVQPQFVERPAECPKAEFRILGPDESEATRARFEAASRKLGAGREDAEPDAQIALARLYVKEGFYAEAESELKRLIERGWEDPRIESMLEELYRKTGRRLSLEELAKA